LPIAGANKHHVFPVSITLTVYVPALPHVSCPAYKQGIVPLSRQKNQILEPVAANDK